MLRSDLMAVDSPGAIAHRILVVEDDAETAGWLKSLLEEHGFRVTIAKDGGQAQSSFVMHRPDFVILDLILPGESGFEICERLKQTDEGVPIMVLSAIDMLDSRALAERVGADGYLIKPVDPDELLMRIREIVQQVWERTHLRSGQVDERRVRFFCRCGKKFKVSAQHRGKSLTCPRCGEPVVVPRHD
jgi:DNA-binding response OmpR family regulator